MHWLRLYVNQYSSFLTQVTDHNSYIVKINLYTKNK